MGHFIPGLCFAALGLGLLLLALWRFRQLTWRNRTDNNQYQRKYQEEFATLHIPEKDPWFLKWFGILCTTGTTVGSLYEIWDKDPGYDPVALTHCTLYVSYFIIGICSLYESVGRLPLDTHRVALVVACIVQSGIWYAHGTMKQLPEDGTLHILLSFINVATAAVAAYSIRYTDSVVAFLSGWALLLLQGIWIVLSGMYECCIDLHAHDIATILALLCLTILLGIVLVAVHCGPSSPSLLLKRQGQGQAKFQSHFTVLRTTDGDDDDDILIDDHANAGDTDAEVAEFFKK